MLKIEYLPLADLKPYVNNAKLHPAEQVEQIKRSITEFGFDDPIAVWGDNTVIEGHGRLIAANELGLETVPVIRLDHLTDEQRKAYALVHNKLTMNSDFDVDTLAAELDGIFDIDMSEFGFDFLDDEEEPKDITEDEAPEPPSEPKSKRGDIYQLGRHRLMCGDSTNELDFAALMDGEKADMVFTDPPYGVAIGDKNKTLNSVQKAGRCVENIENDTLDEQSLYDLLKSAFINVREHCCEDACYFVTSPQGGSLGLMMMMMMRDAGLTVRHVLMWRKNSPTFSLGRLDYDYQHEPIFYTWTKNHHNFRGGSTGLLFGILTSHGKATFTLP